MNNRDLEMGASPEALQQRVNNLVRKRRQRWPRALYQLHTVLEDRVYIVDENSGEMSITNDAEQVVAELLASFGSHRKIVYCDTDGTWAGLLHDGQKFTGFDTETNYKAPVRPHEEQSKPVNDIAQRV